MKSRHLATALLALSISLPVLAQEQGIDPALEKQLTATERQEYRVRMGQAENDAQRNEITQQYRKTVENRTRSGGTDDAAQQQKGKAGGPGHGNPGAGGSGPSGSKNKPQKSGH
jgi:hypothetical protein